MLPPQMKQYPAVLHVNKVKKTYTCVECDGAKLKHGRDGREDEVNKGIREEVGLRET